eukprot:Hpha_TRINITY_DN16107_c2_g1::TRINITY_DN16107_c2_g1_i1::g.4061::m.4061
MSPQRLGISKLERALVEPSSGLAFGVPITTPLPNAPKMRTPQPTSMAGRQLTHMTHMTHQSRIPTWMGISEMGRQVTAQSFGRQGTFSSNRTGEGKKEVAVDWNRFRMSKEQRSICERVFHSFGGVTRDNLDVVLRELHLPPVHAEVVDVFCTDRCLSPDSPTGGYLGFQDFCDFVEMQLEEEASANALNDAEFIEAFDALGGEGGSLDTEVVRAALERFALGVDIARLPARQMTFHRFKSLLEKGEVASGGHHSESHDGDDHFERESPEDAKVDPRGFRMLRTAVMAETMLGGLRRMPSQRKRSMGHPTATEVPDTPGSDRNVATPRSNVDSVSDLQQRLQRLPSPPHRKRPLPLQPRPPPRQQSPLSQGTKDEADELISVRSGSVSVRSGKPGGKRVQLPPISDAPSNVGGSEASSGLLVVPWDKRRRLVRPRQKAAPVSDQAAAVRAELLRKSADRSQSPASETGELLRRILRSPAPNPLRPLQLTPVPGGTPRQDLRPPCPPGLAAPRPRPRPRPGAGSASLSQFSKASFTPKPATSAPTSSPAPSGTPTRGLHPPRGPVPYQQYEMAMLQNARLKERIAVLQQQVHTAEQHQSGESPPPVESTS